MTPFSRALRLTLLPLTLAACASHGGTDEATAQAEQPLTLVRVPVSPPVLRTARSFVTLIDERATDNREEAVAVVPILGGLSGYAVATRRTDDATGIERSYVRNLTGSGTSGWSLALQAGLVVTHLAPYVDPVKGAGFVAVGYTAPTCADMLSQSCTSPRAFIQKLTGTGAALSLRYFDGQLPGGVKPNLPPFTNYTRLYSVTQRPDGAIVAVGETTMPGNCIREPWLPPRTKREGTGMAYAVVLQPGGDAREAAICWSDTPQLSDGGSTLRGVAVLAGNDRFVAAGWRRGVSGRYDAMVVTVATPASGDLALFTGAAYGGPAGNTYATSITRVSDRELAIAGKTSAFDVDRTGDAAFIRKLREVYPIGGYVDGWSTVDGDDGRFLAAPAGWRLFGGSSESGFASVVSSGGRVIGLGRIAFPWSTLLNNYKINVAALPSALVASVDAATGDAKIVRSMPGPGTRTYEGELSAGAATALGGVVGAGWGRAVSGQLKGHTRVLLSQMDSLLQSGDGYQAAPPEQAPTPEPDPPPHAGEAVFFGKVADCKRCHGDGSGGSAPCLFGVSKACAKKRVSCGVPMKMPAFAATLSPTQIDDVADYVSKATGTCAVPKGDACAGEDLTPCL